MTWITALKWATPIWILVIGIIGAFLFLTDFAADMGEAEAIKRLALW
jgi:hypothetical protein